MKRYVRGNNSGIGMGSLLEEVRSKMRNPLLEEGDILNENEDEFFENDKIMGDGKGMGLVEEDIDITDEELSLTGDDDESIIPNEDEELEDLLENEDTSEEVAEVLADAIENLETDTAVEVIEDIETKMKAIKRKLRRNALLEEIQQDVNAGYDTLPGRDITANTKDYEVLVKNKLNRLQKLAGGTISRRSYKKLGNLEVVRADQNGTFKFKHRGQVISGDLKFKNGKLDKYALKN